MQELQYFYQGSQDIQSTNQFPTIFSMQFQSKIKSKQSKSYSIYQRQFSKILQKQMQFLPFQTKYPSIKWAIQKKKNVIKYTTSKLIVYTNFLYNLFSKSNMSFTTQNTLRKSADQYLRKHRIIELMEDLCSDLCYEQPQNVNQFLIERLKLKQKQGFKTGIFSKQQISNIFVLFDLRREGFIDKQRCKQALKTLANNQFQFEQVDLASIPDKIDEKTFTSLCDKVLGIKH